MKVEPGNVYPSKGGKNTKYWIVMAVNGSYCPMLGLDKDMNVVSAHTYGVWALESRKLLFKVDLRQIEFVP